MHIGICLNCRYIDLIENLGTAADSGVFCPRCGTEMNSLGVRTDEWNTLTAKQKEKLVRERFPTHEDLFGPRVTQIVLDLPEDNGSDVNITDGKTADDTIEVMERYSEEELAEVSMYGPEDTQEIENTVETVAVTEPESTEETVTVTEPEKTDEPAVITEPVEKEEFVVTEEPATEESPEPENAPASEIEEEPEYFEEDTLPEEEIPSIEPRRQDEYDIEQVYVCYKCNSIAGHDGSHGKYFCSECGSDMVNVGYTVRQWADLSKDAKRQVTEDAKIMHMVSEIKSEDYGVAGTDHTPSIINVVKDPNSEY